ncbi:MAG: hypothetical protein ACR2OZ_00445 [Verrucomicrobiales bacterium]
MKISRWSGLAAILLQGSAFAAFDVPRHVKLMADLPAAKDLAVKEKKGLAFVFTDPKST